MGTTSKGNNLVHWVFVAAYAVSAVLTLLPWERASKACMLGYRALCSFTPISTVICIGMIVLHVVLARMGANRTEAEAA